MLSFPVATETFCLCFSGLLTAWSLDLSHLCIEVQGQILFV